MYLLIKACWDTSEIYLSTVYVTTSLSAKHVVYKAPLNVSLFLEQYIRFLRMYL